MSTWRQEERRQALAELLAMPDPPGMRRSYRYTCARDPRRDPEETKRLLDVAYGQRRKHEHGRQVDCVVSLRRQPLRIVRRA